MLLLLSSVAWAPEGAEGGGTPPAAEPAPTTTEPNSESKVEGGEVEGAGSLIPEGAAEGDAKPAEPAAEPAAPEPIDLSKLTLPEGMKADDPALAKLAETLTDPKLTPAQRVEALVGQHSEVLKSVATAAQDSIHKQYSDLNAAWVKEVREDPEIGGAKFESTLSTIAKAIDAWSPDAKAMRQALALTGAGNNPAVIRTLHRMAVALSEGSPAQGSAKPPAKSAADLLYGGPATPQS